MMQKSKSSSNVGHLVSKKIWRSRSKSQARAPNTNSSLHKPDWTPQVSKNKFYRNVAPVPRISLSVI